MNEESAVERVREVEEWRFARERKGAEDAVGVSVDAESDSEVEGKVSKGFERR